MPRHPPHTGEATAQLTFRLTPKLKADIERAAAEDDRTVATFIVRALREAIAVHDAKHVAPAKKAAAR